MIAKDFSAERFEAEIAKIEAGADAIAIAFGRLTVVEDSLNEDLDGLIVLDEAVAGAAAPVLVPVLLPRRQLVEAPRRQIEVTPPLKAPTLR